MSSNRKVTIEGADAGFGDLVEKLKKQGEDMYKSMSKEAAEQTRNVDEQYKRINQLIDKQREKLALLKEEQKIAAQMRLDERLEGSKGQHADIGKAYHQQYAKEMHGINQQSQQQQHVLNQASSMNQRGMGGGGRSGRDSGRFGFQANRGRVGSMVAGMGGGALVGGLFSIIGNMFEEGAALEDSSIGLRNLTGGTAGSPGLGLKTSAAQQIMRQFAQGRGDGNFAEIKDQMVTERKIGLDSGALSSLQQFTHQGGGDIGGLTRRVLGMAEKSGLWNVDKGDFSRIHEVMEHVGELMAEEKQFREDGITGSRSAALLTQFGKLGGGFADDRAAGRIESISGGIRNPANEFVKALMMTSIISGSEGRGEELDLLGVRQKMEQGAAGKNVISDVLGGFQKKFGKGTRELQMALAVAFPQLMGNQQALATLSNADPGSMSEDQLNNVISKGGEMDLSGRATSGVVQNNRARIADVMAETGIKMIQSLSGVMETLISGFEKLPKLIDSLLSIGSDIKNFFSTGEAGGTGILDPYDKKQIGGYHYTDRGNDIRVANDGEKTFFDIIGGGTPENADFFKNLTSKDFRLLEIANQKSGGGKEVSASWARNILSVSQGGDPQMPGGGAMPQNESKKLVEAILGLTEAIEKNNKARDGFGGTGNAVEGKYGGTADVIQQK